MSPIVIGHRGARGVMPENTLDGFAFCHAIGVTAIEFDVHVSAEGVPVVTHDPRPNLALVRGADGRWLDAPQPLICETPLAWLKAWNVGALRPGSAYGARYPDQALLGLCRIPTLAEVMGRVAGDAALHRRLAQGQRQAQTPEAHKGFVKEHLEIYRSLTRRTAA